MEGAEARLFADALWDFVQELEHSEGDYDVDLPVFGRLTYGQKASVLCPVRTRACLPDGKEPSGTNVPASKHVPHRISQ